MVNVGSGFVFSLGAGDGLGEGDVSCDGFGVGFGEGDEVGMASSFTSKVTVEFTAVPRVVSP